MMKLQISKSLAALLMAMVVGTGSAFSPVSLTTTASVQEASVDEVHNFLASPENWPKITTSSNSVTIPDDIKQRAFDLGKPVPKGGSVEEIFGLPPILAPSVTWKCMESNARKGSLEFFSEEGLPGVLENARISYDIQKDESGEAANVNLNVSFEPTSPFGVLASIALKIENTIAMKLLLPQEISKKN